MTRFNGIEAIGGVLKRNRLRWFGHVETEEGRKIRLGNKMHAYGGAGSRGRSRITLLEVAKII